MTSNIGSQWFAEMGDPRQAQELRRRIDETVRQQFRSELLNRIDETIIFHQLDRSHIKEIIDVLLVDLAKRLAERGISFHLTPEGKHWLATKGYEPAFGARPLKRAIQQKVQNPLAVELLKQENAEGSRVRVDFLDGDFTFDRLEPPSPSPSPSGRGPG